MSTRVFVGFGFGAIQGGLFLAEAFRSGNFDRLVVAEVLPEVVAAVRRAGDRYRVNVATQTGLAVHEITGVEILNPNNPTDRAALLDAIADASELATALPSVKFYSSIAPLLAEGLRRADHAAVIYTAENHTHAAALLKQAVGPLPNRVQFVDTVIGKMSGVVTESAAIAAAGLVTIADGLARAFLVEEFNRILVQQITLPKFQRGLTIFDEKKDLRPFQEAKLYGHNAVHALLGYLAHRRGYNFLADTSGDDELLALARAAFIEESGRPLIARHAGVDALFTAAGYQAFADDLLARMLNPWLRDAVARVIRDPRRKLAWNDRLIGTMRLALDAGIEPCRFARGAAAAFDMLTAESAGRSKQTLLDELWPEPDVPAGRKQKLKELIGHGS